MRSDGLPRSRLAGGQSERSALVRLARMQDRPALGAEQRDQRGDGRHDLDDRRQIVAERLAEAARLQKVALHVDDDQRGMGGIEVEWERLGGDFDHVSGPPCGGRSWCGRRPRPSVR